MNKYKGDEQIIPRGWSSQCGGCGNSLDSLAIFFKAAAVAALSSFAMVSMWRK